MMSGKIKNTQSSKIQGVGDILKYFLIIYPLILVTFGCDEVDPVKKSLETSEKMVEGNQAIDENLKKLEELQSNERETRDLDGPYPADEYSINQTGNFYFLSLFVAGKDSTWLIIKAKSENEIVKKYPKLPSFKVRPDWIKQGQWFEIRRKCIEQEMVFDLNDEPTGWLLKNHGKLK